MTRKLYLLAAAVIVIAACDKKAAKIEEPSFYEYEISASSADFGTKTTYANDKVFAWSENDKISVLFHNGNTDKFFTLTAKNINGASASFSGSIESGYEIGASDSGTWWALYPAGAHTYTPGESKPFTFNMPAENDLTGTDSSNIPMAAKLAADATEKTFEFYPAAAIIKFRFTGITASKVKLTIEEQYTHAISGNLPMKEGGYVLYWEPAWADLGSAKCKLSYTVDVKGGDAEFFIPFAPWDKRFKPVITLIDADTEDVLYNKTATNFLPETYEPLLTRMVVLPEITVGSAIPWSYESAFGVDWKSSSVVSAAGDPGINMINGFVDGNTLYVLLEINKGALVLDPTHAKDNSVNFHVNTSSRYFGYLASDGVPVLNDKSGYVKGHSVVEHKGVLYYEWKIDRLTAAQKTELADLANSGIIGIRFCIFPNNSSVGSDWNTYMYAPGNGLLELDLPAIVQ